ncbi:MAG TPA: class A beta-lactamase [Sphingopyxis sp.]|nr:class A beta-lactamase [Sphingopyxis sp.]HMP46418.1 class A beta-lactamase [Sphingopyxis sp.]
MDAGNISRRHMLALVPAGLAAGALLAGCKPESPDAPAADAAAAALAALEASAGGRLGVALLDSATGRTSGHRADERFALCSTFKWPLSAVVLHAVEAGKLTLDRRVPYTAADLIHHSPVTEENVAKGAMTVAELMAATITTSDNAAANLLLPLIGGPAGMTERLRAWGDPVTRLDRFEPEMNLVAKDDPRDTTTPAAMTALLRTILFGDALSPASRAHLIDWGAATSTGARRLRAGLPAGWRVSNKTGTGMAPGMASKYNDIAAVTPPEKPPILIAAYYESAVESDKIRDEDQAVLAAIARIAADWVAAG